MLVFISFGHFQYLNGMAARVRIDDAGDAIDNLAG
ncbi:hypothetical protein SAMN05216582_1314 [Selenomonas ruminantium]|uniref:Uncharacterized protein n=1 Tax=Selenomonas ruminantium TaxID=971 RepID=A0A1M6X396_SELRU|nr:hypothetical protein SAMN05216582_1314 [Selenomonas ruminantium]